MAIVVNPLTSVIRGVKDPLSGKGGREFAVTHQPFHLRADGFDGRIPQHTV